MGAVVLGLCAAITYGAADFFGGIATRSAGVFPVVIVSQFIGFVLLLGLLPFLPGELHGDDLLWGAAGGVAGGAGIALLYAALSLGRMGVVSPITAVIAAAVPVVAGLAFGERPAPLQITGIACAIAAVWLISASSSTGAAVGKSGGIREALGSGLALGAFYVLLAHAHRDAGLFPLVGARAGSVCFLALTALAARRSIRLKAENLPTTGLAGLLDMSANAFYVLGTHAGLLSIVAVLTSLYPGSTILMARLFLRERLAPKQLIGVGCAFAGVVLLALP